MKRSILDRIACLLIIGALSVGSAKTLPAQTIIADVPGDIYANAVQAGDVWWLNGPGGYSAARTETSGGVFDDNLGIARGVRLSVRGEESASGLDVARNVYLDGGALIARADGFEHSFDDVQNACSAGISISGGDFVLRDGYVSANGQNGGDGIRVDSGDFVVHGGQLDAFGTESSRFSIASNQIIIREEHQTHYYWRNEVYYGCGVVVGEGDFILNDGTVHAAGSDGGCGIVVDKGNLRHHGGNLFIHSGDGREIAAMTVGGNAYFGPDGSVVVGFDAQNDLIGTILVAGDTEIAEGAQLDIMVSKGSVFLDKDKPLNGTFLKAEKYFDDTLNPTPTGTIRGTFETEGNETLTLLYEIEKSSDQKQYDITVSRKADASELLKGNNARLAAALERDLPLFDYERKAGLHEAYSALDRSLTLEEMDRTARSLTPWMSTRYALIGLGLADSTQLDMSRNLEWMRQAKNSCDPCDEAGDCGPQSDARHLWFAGHGHFGHFGGSGSYGALDVDSYGMNVGMARRLAGFGRNTVAGISFNYTNGNVDGDGGDADYDHYGFLASLRTDLRRIRGWGELNFGYSHGDFDQGRSAFDGSRHYASLDNDLVRFGLTWGRDFHRKGGRRITPIAALEYTNVRQGRFTERGDFGDYDLAVGGDNLNSLRLRVGAEMERRRNKLNWSVFGFFRYEMLDRNMVFDTRFRDTPSIRFDTRGQKVNRCSGMTGAKLDWQISAGSQLGAGYDFTVGDRYTEHWVNFAYRRSW